MTRDATLVPHARFSSIVVSRCHTHGRVLLSEGVSNFDDLSRGESNRISVRFHVGPSTQFENDLGDDDQEREYTGCFEGPEKTLEVRES